MEKLLVHHCCAPCSYGVLLQDAVGVIERLTGFEIEGFWYNPNIHPFDEHQNRFNSLKRFLEARKIPLHLKNDFVYDCEAWKRDAPELMPERCAYCYYIRLNETAYKAKQLQIPNFTTTLLSSPHQKHELIKNTGERVSAAYGIKFLYRDFRPSYYKGRNEARQNGMYMQKYCGCEYSINERTVPSKPSI